MPKVASNKRSGAAQSSPYARASAKTKGPHNIFKLNTEIGQHVLKNPGVAQAIVDKADLKQSDVSIFKIYRYAQIWVKLIFSRLSWKSAQGRET